MYSIFSFFQSLVEQRNHFHTVAPLENFPFNEEMFSCRNKGSFPDMAIRLNVKKTAFTGGEFIELKDSNSYVVASFNSTIPTGKKSITEVVHSKNSNISRQMEAKGENVFSLPIREVYYLVRGRRKNHVKVCLTHGSFFETIDVKHLIAESFSQVLEEKFQGNDGEITEAIKHQIAQVLSEQQGFSKVRNVEKASVKLRFRVMTEVRAEGNILDPKQYSLIMDDTLNFLLPCHDKETELGIIKRAERVFQKSNMNQFSIFQIKHHFNGHFLVFQVPITETV